MRDPFPLRPITDAEFPAWARVVTDTYGSDLSDEELANEQGVIELDRTIAAFDGAAAVAGTAAYSRELTVPGAVLPVAGVTWVGVAPTHRRRGILTSMMRKQLDDLRERGEPIAALRPSEATIYGRYGYASASRGARLRCDKRAMRFRPATDFGGGAIRTAGAEEARPLLESVYESVRTSAVGWTDRTERFWNYRLFDHPVVRGGASALRCVLHQEPDGRTTGYSLHRFKSGKDIYGASTNTVQVVELAAVSRQAYAALWRFLTGIDLMTWIEFEGAADEPLPHLLTDERAVQSSEVDRLWVRLVDVDRALAGRRYTTPLDVVLDVRDDFCPWNTARFRLAADDDKATCERTGAAPDLRLSVAELGAVFLGGTTLASLGAAGLVQELHPGALARASTAFRGIREPCYPGGWAFPAY